MINCSYRFAIIFIFLSSIINAQIPKPSDIFGFEVGADYKLADYDQMLSYYEKLANATDRVQMIDIGKSVMNRPIKLLFISSAENMKSLEKWRLISEQLSRATISDRKARTLSVEGKAVVWIDGGMHATERAHAQMTSELMWRIAAEESDEMKKIRDNVITLIVPVINPDGVDIVVDWYKKNIGTPFETTGPPILYQKYVGHDNNRDWFMNNMPETKAATNILFNEWYPQIVHNHHQTSPSWARIFLPPFRSPVNPNIHPGVTTSVNLVGTAMAQRFAMKKMPGVISGTSFSMFWNGGMRTTPYYHNQIGILTEVAHATPTPRYYDPKKKPKNVGRKPSDGTEIFYPYPWKGGESHFRDAVNYMMTASIGILDLAADKKDEFLYNIYSMGRDAINNSDEAFAYIIPKNQWNPSEAINLANILMQGGIRIHQTTKPFTIDDKTYEKESIIIYGAQSFRPYLVDLMEKQNYPDQFLYPGGPPQPPYDLAGWTLPLQMGVEVDRINKSFEVQSRLITSKLQYDTGKVSGAGHYLFSNKDNLSALVVNRLQKAGFIVGQLHANQAGFTQGSFVVESAVSLKNELSQLSKQFGINFKGIKSLSTKTYNTLKPIKVGIYKSWQANMDEGWTRWMLEQFEFDIDTLHNKDIQNSSLSKYSAIIIPSQRPENILHGHLENSMPSKFTGGIELSGMTALDNYVSSGGTLLCFDAASDLAIEQLGLPIRNVVSGISTSDFFIPGSLIKMRVDTLNSLGYGMQKEVAASFNRSRAFQTIKQRKYGEGGTENIADAPKANVIDITTYGSKNLLMSGWAMGEERYLKNKSAMMHIPRGDGHIILYGFRPQFRGQPRGTYKLIFNALYLGAKN